MNLDNRLKGIADLIEDRKLVLDVGTDHGYLCIYLIAKNKTEKAIATDISKGSLQKAIDLVSKEDLQGKIECRLGSGIEVAKMEDDVDTIIISGMGGILIADILEKSKEYILRKKPLMVLQPIQRPEILRKYLVENGYKILYEELVKSDGKIYNIIKCELADGESNYDSNYYEIGYLYDKNKKNIYKEQVNFFINKYANIVQSMANSKGFISDEIEKKKRYIKFLEELLNGDIK